MGNFEKLIEKNIEFTGYQNRNIVYFKTGYGNSKLHIKWNRYADRYLVRNPDHLNPYPYVSDIICNNNTRSLFLECLYNTYKKSYNSVNIKNNIYRILCHPLI